MIQRFLNEKEGLIGWLVFALSLTVYLIGLEPTASFWDCGEFISCSNGLMISHPPGAPLFTLIGRLFAMFASDPSQIAWWVNASSAVASAFTVFFLYHSIILLYAQLVENSDKWMRISTAVLGSLSFAFTDSFWFSAGETEVYALACFFISVLFWSVLKWSSERKDEQTSRWFLLIAYLLGLSLGVHFISILTVPAIVAVVYFQKAELNLKSLFVVFLISVGILLALMLGVLQWLPLYLSKMELLFVNAFHFPYHSGTIAGIIFLGIIFYLAIRWANSRNWFQVRFYLFAFVLTLVGFSSYSMLVIRSHDNPAIDMSNVESPFAIANLLNREQYGRRPLLYGHSFESPIVNVHERFSYQKNGKDYTPYELIPNYEYHENSLSLFPRMYSEDASHVRAYKQWTNFKGKKRLVEDMSGNKKEISIPTFAENLTFLFRYQMGHMYWRYFLWNFSGRQNHVQGVGELKHGNWISGIPFMDNVRLGDQSLLPDYLKNSKANNRYFMLPLILGLIGALFFYRKNRKAFTLILLLFFSTGLAIVLYLNEIPVTPRERDYVYVGSFYAFCIFIGFALPALWESIQKFWQGNFAKTALIAVCLMASPVLLFSENFNDHSRAGRYWTLEYARNFLNSCEPNAILFTAADNDTYPLWYAQQVEGIRPDISVVLQPYLSSHWYLDLVMENEKKNNLKCSFKPEDFMGGKNVHVLVYPRVKKPVSFKELTKFIRSKNKRTKLELSNGDSSSYIPTDTALVSVYSEKGREDIAYSFTGKSIRKDQILVLDFIHSNDRPVYFASPMFIQEMGLLDYVEKRGFAYKLTSKKEKAKDYYELGRFNADLNYELLMKEYQFGSLEDETVWRDWTHLRNLQTMQLRNLFYRTASKLYADRKLDKCRDLIQKLAKLKALDEVEPEPMNVPLIELAYLLGEEEIAQTWQKQLRDVVSANHSYFGSLDSRQQAALNRDIRVNFMYHQQLMELAQKRNNLVLLKELETEWKNSVETLPM